MNIFEFKYTNTDADEFTGTSTTYRNQTAVMWPDLLEQFYFFLRSQGYVLSKKQLLDEFGTIIKTEEEIENVQ